MKPEIKRKKSLTPKSKAIRGLVSHNSWYQDTFKDELNILKDSNNTPPPPPPSNNNDIPKLPIPKLQNKSQKNNVNMKISKKRIIYIQIFNNNMKNLTGNTMEKYAINTTKSIF